MKFSGDLAATVVPDTGRVEGKPATQTIDGERGLIINQVAFMAQGVFYGRKKEISI